MPEEHKSFIPVDELVRQVEVEKVAAFYGVNDVQFIRSETGTELRSRCFLHCGKAAETGERALAIDAAHPGKQWRCFQQGCAKGGNLVSLCDLLKPGESAGGRPRGQRFKEIAADLRAMVQGVLTDPEPSDPAPAAPTPPPGPPCNLPLAQSANERARSLTELDRKFVLDIAGMPPRASAYFRRRPFLTEEVCRQWRMGYLPRDTGEDKSGGTMRGKIVYPCLSDAGEVLTWFGRDPEFEDRHTRWQASDRSEKEPEKFHFVKGFHRGLELFGQHVLRTEAAREHLRRLGLLVVEGPNDAIRLATLGIPAVAICGHAVTREQAVKAARIARELGNGIVHLFLDCDAEGEAGMRQSLGYAAQAGPVRLPWTSKMYGGKFQGRQVESLTPDEWIEIEQHLLGGDTGWSLS